MESFDLVVIGSGPAGEKAAAQAAFFGKRVTVVESSDVGGAPVNRGGIPTKTLRETALYLTSFRRRDIYGVGMELEPELTLDHLRTRAASVADRARSQVLHNLQRHGIELVHGVGRLGESGTVVVEDVEGTSTVLETQYILLASGSRPFHPPGVPFDDPDVRDSDTILRLDRLPRSMAVIGGGPVGSEYASIATALGVEVTIIDAASRYMPLLDEDVADQLKVCLGDVGMDFRLNSPGASISREDGILQVALADGKVLTPEIVLFAAGRAGNTEALSLPDAGVAVDERGRIVVDDTYQTTVPGIYAAGDVIGPPALGSVSAEQGRVAVCHAFDIPFKESVDPLPPFGIYTIPEVGMVGLTEQAAADAGIDYEVGVYPFELNTRSLIAGTTYGLLKLVFDRNDKRLLGTHVVGEEAAELVHIGQAVIHAGETIDRFIHTTFNIPTRAEAYKYAAYDGLQRLAGVHVDPADTVHPIVTSDGSGPTPD